MKSFFSISLRYLKENSKRTVLTIIGIILSVSLFSGIFNVALSYRDVKIENVKKMSGNYMVKYLGVNYKTAKKITENAEVLNSGLKETPAEGVVYNGTKATNVSVFSYSSETFKNILNKYFNIKKGRLPESSDEIAIENIGVYSLGGKNVGDKLTINLLGGEKKTYTIVGIYDPMEYSSAGVDCITQIDADKIADSTVFDVYVNLKDKKNIVAAAQNIAKQNGISYSKSDKEGSKVNFNERLLSLYMQSTSSKLKTAMMKVLAFVITLIVVCCVAVIYNVFNISVMQRIKYFGIMRSIGATPHQIRKIIVYEALIMCIIAVPLGFIFGYFGVYAVLKIIGSDFFDVTAVSLKMYPEALIICTALTVGTVFISIFGPARVAGKVSPIDAIRNVQNIKNENIKRRKSGIGKLLFGFEGDLAGKNIKRVPKRFYITIFSITISIILFMVFSTILEAEKSYSSTTKQNTVFDSELTLNDDSKAKMCLTQKDYNEAKSLKGIDKVYRQSVKEIYSAIQKDKINNDYIKKTGKQVKNIEGTDYSEIGDKMFMSYIVRSYDDETLKMCSSHLLSGSADKNKLNDMGVILINRNRFFDGKGQPHYVDFSTYKVGDKITVPQFVNVPQHEDNSKEIDSVKEQIKSEIDNKKFYTFTVVGIIDTDVISSEYPDNGLGLVFSEDTYKKLFNNEGYDTFWIKFKDKKASEDSSDYFISKAQSLNGNYVDRYKIQEEGRNGVIQMQVIFYGFVAIIALIGIVNIVNTLFINIMMRKREFATLKAVGMTEGQVTKMVLLEGASYAVIASVIGILIGFGLSELFFSLIDEEFVKSVRIPAYSIVISFVVPLFATLMASLASLKNIKCMNIVDNIKME